MFNLYLATNSSNSIVNRRYIDNLFRINIEFLSRILEVKRLTTNNIIDVMSSWTACEAFADVLDTTIGIPDSDLHIYLSTIDVNYYNYDSVCRRNTSSLPFLSPRFAIIYFNPNQIQMVPVPMLNKLITIHLQQILDSFIRILGISFRSSFYWID